jgi:hypothetical protein
MMDVPDHGWTYPLRFGDTLASNDWAELKFHNFLGSSFLAHAIFEGRRADIGTAWILWSECYRQDPAGTLPDDDVELAQLAKFGTDVAAWLAVRDHVLRGWEVATIEGGERRGKRLGHPSLITGIAERSFRRKSGKAQGREASKLAGIKFKLRKKLVDMGRKKLAEQDHPVMIMAQWLDQAGLHVTAENVLAALEQIGAGSISVFPGTATDG